MPVTSVTTDADALTLTLVAELAAPPERVWTAFTDPRQLERFWGPPGWPAVFETFSFAPGGIARYAMTGPRGESARGRWEFTRIDEGVGFDVLDSFEDDDGAPNPDLPASRMTFEISAAPDGARLRSVTTFPSAEALQQLTSMGMVEGVTLAMNQLDLVLRGLRDDLRGEGTRVEVLDDRHVRITRVIEGPRAAVWRAHNDAELLKRWMLGPDGWTMPVAEPAAAAGQGYRYVWQPEAGTAGERFGFEGEAVLLDEPRRAVTTERMIGMEGGPELLNDLSFHEDDGVTLLTLVIEYPDAATRDLILDTGMAAGMEASYARLDALLAG